MDKVFVFGHKKPDTDSVAASIALAYLKQKTGINCEARILGNVNKETKYALDYFNIKEPVYLNDVKLQIKDVNYHKGFFLEETDSIFNGYRKMLEEGLTGLPIVKNNNEFAGLITIKDMSHTFIYEEGRELNTSYDNLLDVLEGEEILHFNEEIKGNIIVASYRSTTFLNNVRLNKNMVLIVGDRHSIIEYAVESKIKLIIIAGNGEIKKEHLEKARENKVNIVRCPYDTYHIAKLVSLSNYISTMVRSFNPTKFEDTDYVDNVLEINNKLRHTNYPIVNKQNKCLGLLRITDLNDKSPKKVILVDHNEKSQSVDGIDEALILEIIDHHNLGNITTNVPINFRNMAVGSTNTILYNLYLERNISIPKEIAGMMLSGILSDTLVLKSPTATDKDREAVKSLSIITGVDYKEYGMNLLKAGTSLKGMSKENVLYNDFKVYTVNEKTFAVGQFFTMNFDEIKKELDEYIKVLDEVSVANSYSLVALYVTDIVKNGSYIIYNTKAKNNLEMVYDIDNLEQGHFFENCVSRKKHVIPIIMDMFND